MKKLSLILLGTALVTGLHAGELLENSDFSQGFYRWHGDVTAGNSNQTLDPNPATPVNTGLAVPLSATRWMKVYQDFIGHGGQLTIEIQYKLSSDTAFSTNKDDYANVSHSIGYDAWKPFKLPDQNWCLFVSDFGIDGGHFFHIKPKFGSADPQTLSAKVPCKDDEKKTITLAFPPGQGTLTLLKVSVTNDQ